MPDRLVRSTDSSIVPAAPLPCWGVTLSWETWQPVSPAVVEEDAGAVELVDPPDVVLVAGRDDVVLPDEEPEPDEHAARAREAIPTATPAADRPASARRAPGRGAGGITN